MLWRDAISAIDAATAALVAAADEARTAEARSESGDYRAAGRRATVAARMLTRAALVAADCRNDEGDGLAPRAKRVPRAVGHALKLQLMRSLEQPNSRQI